MAIYNTNNNKDEKKKGFLPFFSRMFNSTSKAAGGIGSSALKSGGALGKAGFFASLFSTKAGIVGLILGAATIAAGIGLIYNYISPSSGKIYTPALFSDAYYQEAQRQANSERASSDIIPPGESTLSKFAEAAQKEFGSSLPKDEESNPNSSNQSESALPPEVAAPQDNNASSAKLQAQLGFNNSSGQGGSNSAGAKLQTSGGLWSSMGKQLSPGGGLASKAQTAGKAGNMNKGLTARLIASPKYHVPNINKRGAFGQAKFAANVGKGAAYQASDAGARTTAEQAFSGETAGSGDIAVPIGGTGLGGAGLNQGKLKANDPALNTNEYTPPTPNKSDDSPWKKLTDYALYAMLASAAFIAIAKMIANKAKALMANPLTAPQAASMFAIAKMFCMLAIAAAGVVIAIAVQLASKYGQKMMGLMYGMVGGALIIQAIRAMYDMNADGEKAMKAGEFYDKCFSQMNEGQQAAFKAMPVEQQWNIVNNFDAAAYQANSTDYLNTIGLGS